MVQRGTKRGFDSYPTFLKLGFTNDMGVSLYNNEVEQIPVGATITADEVKDGVGKVSPYYMPIARTAAADSGGVSTFVSSAVPDEVVQERIRQRQRLRHQNTPGQGNQTAPVLAGKHGKCEVNEALETMVRTPGTRCILYLIAHDTDSEHLARKFSSCKESWIQPVRINSSVFFESVIYRDVFPPYQKEWEDLDYVVTATYKTVAKQLAYNKYTQSLELIQNSLQIARDGNFDIVPFLRSGSGTMSFCLYHHGKPFRAAWDALLVELGYSLSLIRSLDEMKSFYRNIFIIKPKVLKELMMFMSKAMHVATHNPAVRELLQVDARYKEGSQEVSKRIFGTEYYQLHPFIFERLPSFFLHASEAKICAATAGPCPYNS